MKKNISIILLALIAIIGSIITFYSVNMLMSDLSNMFYGVHDSYYVSSIPLFMIALDFVLAYIFLLRYTRYPIYKKALIKLYTLFLITTSLVGLVSSIFTGTIIYGSFIKPYPFPLYTLICLLLHLLLLMFAIYIRFIKIKQIEDDNDKKKIKVKYAIYSALTFALTIYAFNRFGAFVLSPIYIQYSTLYLTIYFYLSLLGPIACLIHITVYFLDGYKNKEKIQLVVISIIGLLFISLGIIVLYIGYNYPAFISAISPCLPLERLATKPIGTIAQLIFAIVFSLYYIVYSFITYKKKAKV